MEDLIAFVSFLTRDLKIKYSTERMTGAERGFQNRLFEQLRNQKRLFSKRFAKLLV